MKELCVVVALLGSMLAGTGVAVADSAARDAAATNRLQDGPVFEGSAPSVPGSFARLVLEKNYRQTQRLRWESSDARIGAAEVDFFEPREWRLEGDPPDKLTFVDRSPGPILFGEVQLVHPHRAVVNVVLGRDRVTYTLDRVERDETR